MIINNRHLSNKRLRHSISHRLEATNQPRSEQLLSLVSSKEDTIVPSNVPRDSFPVLRDIIFENEYILLELAEHHETPILREGGTHREIPVVDYRVTWITQNDRTWLDNTLTGLRFSNIPV